MTLIDIRLEYKKATGDPAVTISHGYYGSVQYVMWLEEQLLLYKKLHAKFIPWEPIEVKENV